MPRPRDLTLIVNATAGNGRGRRVVGKVLNLLEERGFRPHLRLTTFATHAEELARNASTEVVVAAGGDGTINEVVNGIGNSGRILGIVPCGSGNDLVKTLGIPDHLAGAVDIIRQYTPMSVDLGVVKCSNTERLFVNGVGIGFDAAVAAKTRTIPVLRGTALYVAAVLLTLGKYRAPTFRISLDEAQFEQRCLLIAVGNGRCSGGGFYLTPDALIDDGQLDVCSIGNLSPPGIIRLMPSVLNGRHVTRNDIRMSRVRSVKISGDKTFCVHADGEIVGSDVTRVEVGVRSKALRVLTSRKEHSSI